MDKETRIAFIIAQAALLNAEIAAMQAGNLCYPSDLPHSEGGF